MAGNFKTPLTQDELKHLENVIGELEKKTSGEIRLMIVQRSMPTSWELIAAALIFGFAFLWIERHLLLPWIHELILIIAVPAVSIALGLLLNRIPFFVRNLSSALRMRAHAIMRAELEFYREGLGATAEKTGILLFLSMCEHQAVVLADKGIAGKLKPEVWNQVIKTMLEGPKTGRWSENLEKALRQCGSVLAEHFPIQPGDHDELPNLVIVKP